MKAALRFLCRTFCSILLVIGFFAGVVACCGIFAMAVVWLQEGQLQAHDRRLLAGSALWLAGACLFVFVTWRLARLAGERADYLRYRKHSPEKPDGRGDKIWLLFLFLMLTPALWRALSGPPILKFPALAGWLIFAFLGLHLQIFLHELGHFTAAWAMKFRLRKMQVGIGPRIWSWSFANGLRFEWRAWSLGGYVMATNPAAKNFRGRQFLFVAAGPLSNVILLWAGYNLMVSEALGPAFRDSACGLVLGLILLWTGITLIGDVIPRTAWLAGRKVRTDGYWLWLLLTGSDKRLATLSGQMRWQHALESGSSAELPPWFVPAVLPVAATDPSRKPRDFSPATPAFEFASAPPARAVVNDPLHLRRARSARNLEPFMAKGNPNAIAKALKKHALSYPETTEEFPWGESAFKVKGKTFVFMRADPGDLSFSVKLPKSRARALELPGSEPTHYGMGAKGWVTLRPTAKTPLKTLIAFIDESYRAVAPKRVVSQLEGR